ncbi:MAG: glycosyltransferase family 4 protein [Pseudomonadota bacterium]
MRLLIVIDAFHPETKSASTLYFELAESLVKKGHDVSVITRRPRHNVASGTKLDKIPSKEIMSGIKVHRFWTPPLARNIPFIRGLEHFLLGLIFFLGGLSLGKYDVILVYSPPLPLGIAGYWLGKIKKCPVIVNIQDLYPQTVIALNLLKNKALIWLSKRMESFVYRKASFIVANSENNRQHILKCGANKDAVGIVSNWVDTDAIKPGPKSNEFGQKYGLEQKFVVSFAGVMGFAQGLEVVIDTANILKNNKDIVFLMVGDGIKKKELVQKAESYKLNNIIFVPTQPLSVYPQILHSSDISLVVLNKLLATALPGKTFSILASGIPLVTSVPLEGGSPKIIERYQCGLSVKPGDAEALAKAILKLYNNKTLSRQMGNNGRKAAEAVFSRKVAANNYEKIMSDLVRKGQ